jgi:hypothetical protein
MSSARDVSASEIIIEWTAPRECPGQSEVVSGVDRALGDGAKASLTAIVRVTKAGDTYRAKLHITSAAGFGDRELEDTQCEILAESVALVIALSASRSTTARGDVPRGAHHPGLALALAPHATALAGALPALAIGAGVTLAVEGFAALRLELSGTYYARQSSTFGGTDPTRIGGTFDLLRFSARGCRLWALGAVQLGPCAGAQLYRIGAAGFGGMISRPGESLMWAPAIGVFGRLQLLPRFGIQLAADAALPTTRQRFVFSDLGPLHRPSVLLFQLFVAPEVLL